MLKDLIKQESQGLGVLNQYEWLCHELMIIPQFTSLIIRLYRYVIGFTNYDKLGVDHCLKEKYPMSWLKHEKSL